MSDKKPPTPVSDVVHDAGEFQLTRDMLHIPAVVNRKALGLDFGWAGNAAIDKVDFDGIVNAFLFWLNNLDLTHDKKSDIAQAAPYVIKILPYAKVLIPLIKPEGIIAWVKTHPEFFKNVKAAHDAIDQAALLAAEATAKLAPKG